MALTAVVLVAVGAVFLALYGVMCRKEQSGDWKNRTSALVALSQGGAAMLFFSVSCATGGPHLQTGWLFPVIFTGVLNIGIMYAKMRARALEDVSLVAPIDSTTPAIVIVTSMIILGEYPSTLGWLGIWLMVVGTYILNIQDVRQKLSEKVVGDVRGWRRQARIWFAPFLALGRSRGVRWAFFAAMTSTVSLNYDGLVARRTDIGFGFGCVMTIAAAGNLVVALARREFRGAKLGAILKKTAVLSLSFGTAIFISSLAYRLSIVPYVGTMKRLQIPMTIVLAYFILGEHKSFRERLSGGLLMTAGAVLIVLG